MNKLNELLRLRKRFLREKKESEEGLMQALIMFDLGLLLLFSKVLLNLKYDSIERVVGEELIVIAGLSVILIGAIYTVSATVLFVLEYCFYTDIKHSINSINEMICEEYGSEYIEEFKPVKFKFIFSR